MNGGPAFPQCVSTDHDGQRVCSFDFVDGAGMDLRDYFAAHALAALIQRVAPSFPDAAIEARNAYRIADAMLEARKS